jgi:hypothetical protein
MGTTQSTRTNAKEITFSSPIDGKTKPSSVSGRKTHPEISSNRSVVVSFDDDVVVAPENEEEIVTEYVDTDDSLFDENEVYDFDFEDDSDDDEVEEEEEEEDEEWNERLAILQDARNLKQMANFYLNPHKPVVVSPEAMGRNYFERPSAPAFDAEEEEEERALILKEAAAFQKLAVDYMCPEKPVATSDPTACGRNYFDRASAPETVSCEEADERARILQDAANLKQLAVDYLHPELPVVTTDPTACGRNYFSRPSALEQQDEEMEEERTMILQEMAHLKQLAVDYLHPELPVVTTDPTACGRNYFSRPSAEGYEEEEMMDEREDILQELAQLKQLAVDYLHPERPVQVDALACCRNYFDRASAPETTSREEADEIARILEDAAALKKLAVDYMHPELPVVTSDPTACGRNYFDRPSAEGNSDGEDNEEWEQERAQILSDASALKQLAVDYLHPELPVQTTDPNACGRNYFSRYSAEEYEEPNEERDLILQEMKQLKKLAVDYLHPELAVQADGFCSARNYFSRYSAEEQEEEEMMDDREDVLEDAAALKKLALDYLHPERPIVVDALASSRNYFDRASAPETVSREEAEERAQILEDAANLKQLAVDYLHPELPVKTTDAFACGRNYFSRPAALEQEEEMEERDLILQEMAQLKQLAVDYMHPELPVVTSDPTACGRNYFSRASAEEYEEEEYMDEREDIMEDLAQLKQLAVDYLQPERAVQVDPLMSYRNYFDRASAPETLPREEADERAQILADAAALKKLAVDYMHPEFPVVTSDPTACGRNYFSRPSAEDEEYEQERALILQDMRQMKQLAVDYLHPELPVQTTDPCACGRNYFTRASAEEYKEKDEERELILEDMKQLKQLAVDYMHPELPVKMDGFATARNYFSRPSAPEQVSVEDMEEEVRILQDMQQLEKLADDYLHPEKPVKSSAGARCYFDRASAAGHADHMHSEGMAIEAAPAAADTGNAYHPYHAYHEQVLGLVSGDHEYHDHSEHFDMDMDEDLQTFKDNLRMMSPNPQQPKEKATMAKGIEEDEGNLSRSPSSIMLFDLAGC